MKRIMVRYKVKAGRAAENEALIGKVFEQLKREQPAGLRYAAFKAFTAQIKDRCEEPPVPAELAEVGSYRFFGA